MNNSTSLADLHVHDSCEAYFKDEGSSDLLQEQNGSNISAGELEVRYNMILHQACKEGLLCKVQYIISQKLADINCRGKFGGTPIMEAARHGHVAVFDFLVSEGCDLKAADDHNDTVLHVACIGGDANIIRKLLQSEKCNIDARGSNLWTPVMVAAYFGQGEAFEILVTKGCSMTLLDHIHYTILHIACHGGNVNIVRYIVSQNITITDTKGYNGMTPLMMAVERGHRKVFDLLRDQGCDVKVVDDYKRNILHFACKGGHVNMVKYIISQKIHDIESRESWGRTPVMISAEQGHVGVFYFLALKGCNLTTVDNHRDTILHIACQGGHVDIVKHIISQDIVGIDSRDYRGRTPVMIAALYGHRGVINILKRAGCSLGALDEDKNNILHLACMNGKVDMVRHILLEGIVDKDSRGFVGRTPVMLAAGHGHKEVVRFLLGKGCNMRILDEQRNSILHVACISGHVDVVKYILTKHIVEIDDTASLGRTPVMIATIRGHRELVELLVSKGCNVKITDEHKYNILHLACIGGQVDIVRYILSQAVADIDSRGFGGETPVLLAADTGHIEVVKLLWSWGCNLRALDSQKYNILHAACMGGHIDVVSYVLSLNVADIDSRGFARKTPVLLAAGKGHIKVVKLLVSKDCDLRALDGRRNNVLHVACHGGDVNMVKYILSLGIAVESRGYFGLTPVMFAVERGHRQVVDLLRSKGCNLRAIDEYGNNIIHVACKGGHVDMVRYLLKLRIVNWKAENKFGTTPVKIAQSEGHRAVVTLFGAVR